MKKLNEILLFLFAFLCFNAFCQTEETKQTEFQTNSECINHFQFELKGNLDERSINNVSKYILSKKGICEVNIDAVNHIITLKTTRDVDEKSLAALIRYAKNFFINEECNHEHQTSEE